MIAAPIISAGKRPLSASLPGPDMRSTVQGWSRQIVLSVVTLTSGEGGDAVRVARDVPTQGFTVQSKARDLDIKEDGTGTRAWRYWALYTLDDPAIRVADEVTFEGVTYKVMKSWNRGQNGFFKFGLREDFQ